MSQNDIDEALKEAEKQDEKVLFTNIFLEWDSCDCNDGYCSHGKYVVGLTIVNEKNIEIDFADGDSLQTSHGASFILPTTNATVYDFYRMCEILEIKLEFSEYAKNLLNKENK